MKSDDPSYDLRNEHERTRERIARQSYINWRMRDLPAVYQDLLPYSYMTAELWAAEKAIRTQLAADLEHLESPWRQVGPVPSVLCDDGMTPDDLLTFALDVNVAIGMPDKPKPERDNHRDVTAARAAQRQHPDYVALVEYSDLFEERSKLHDAHRQLPADADDATRAASLQGIEEVNDRINAMIEKTPKLGNMGAIFATPIDRRGNGDAPNMRLTE